MNKKSPIKYVLGAVIIALYSAHAMAATDATVESIARSLIPQLKSVGGLMMIFSYVAGFGMGVMGILKLKEQSESKGQIKLMAPVILLVCAALLVVLPTVIDMGIVTIGFNTSGQKTFSH